MNPYESPATENESPTKLPPTWRRWVAALLWLAGLQPTALLVVTLLEKGFPASLVPIDPPDWVALGPVLFLFCFVPLLGFGLLGLATWRWSGRLALAGGLVVAASGFVILAVCP